MRGPRPGIARSLKATDIGLSEYGEAESSEHCIFVIQLHVTEFSEHSLF